MKSQGQKSNVKESGEVVLPLTMKALKDSGLREEQICWQKKGLGLGQQQWGSDNTSIAVCVGGGASWGMRFTLSLVGNLVNL